MATEKDATEEAQINEIVKSYTSRNRFSEREIQTILHDADAWQIRGFVFAGFQEGIQSERKRVLEEIDKAHDKITKLPRHVTPDGASILTLELSEVLRILKALRDKVAVEK